MGEYHALPKDLMPRLLFLALLTACGGRATTAAGPQPASAAAGKSEELQALTGGLESAADVSIAPLELGEDVASALASAAWEPLPGDDAAALSAVIFEPGSYHLSANARCRFSPARALQYRLSGEPLHVLLAGPWCPKAQFLRGDERLLIDMREEAAAAIVAILGEGERTP